MKSASLIFLLVLLVSVHTPLGQLFKLPILIGHFIKHQDNDDVSLIRFLEDHYSPGHNDADLPEDEQLPFKNITLHPMGFAIVPGLIKTASYVPLLAGKKVIFPDTYVPQQHLSNVFHPPRV